MSQPTDSTPSRGAREAGPDQEDERLSRGGAEVLELAQGLGLDLERLRQAQARASGLRPPSWALLVLVAQAGEVGVTVSDAALGLGVRPQALSGSVAELVDEGLLQREVDSTDGRARRLKATALGQRRLLPGEELRQRLLVEIVAQIPQPSVAKLVLTRLRGALRHCLGEVPKAQD